MRRTAGYIWTDYKTNTQIAEELNIIPILDKLLEYKRNWIRLVNRIFCNRLPRVRKHFSPTGRRNHGRSLKRFLGTWDRNGSTSGPSMIDIYDDDDVYQHNYCTVCLRYRDLLNYWMDLYKVDIMRNLMIWYWWQNALFHWFLLTKKLCFNTKANVNNWVLPPPEARVSTWYMFSVFDLGCWQHCHQRFVSYLHVGLWTIDLQTKLPSIKNW